MELISRDEVAERLEIVINHGIPSENGLHLISAESVLETIKELPIIEERKEGRNLKAEYPSLFECSECGWECWDTMPCDTVAFNYCPNCGVKMKGE